jgi:membrane protease YdiL (CAAX protease family)
MPKITFFTGAWYTIPLFFLATIAGGPLGEEFGWRGFAQPNLQQKKNALSAALVIGFAWGLWHLPQFFTPGTIHHSMGIVYLPLFVLGELALSVVMAWIFNRTHESLLLAGFLFHNADNFWGVALTTDATAASALAGAEASVNMTLWVISIVIYAVFAVVLIIITKGRLGFRKCG